MAFMRFREGNQVKWVGSRPGHNGEQVLDRSSVTNGTTVVYTVPAGQVFYLCFCALGVSIQAAGQYTLRVYTDGAALKLIPLRGLLTGAGEVYPVTASFWPPIEMAAGWYVLISSSAAGLTVYGEIAGWVE